MPAILEWPVSTKTALQPKARARWSLPETNWPTICVSWRRLPANRKIAYGWSHGGP